MRTQADHADVAASAAEISATVTAQDAAADAGTGAARRPGRPRSERAEQAILDATLEAIAERGVDGVGCEDVAARAGVGKATLYRRWPGKEDLLIATHWTVLADGPSEAWEALSSMRGLRAPAASRPRSRRAADPGGRDGPCRGARQLRRRHGRGRPCRA